MNEQETIDAFIVQQPVLKRWLEEIRTALLREFGESMFKLPLGGRVKDVNSFANKAFRRNKNYSDPLNDITDKAGLRAVVLLDSEVSRIGEFVQTFEGWMHSKDRDYERERKEHPLAFDYQSDHFILRPRGSDYPERICCEFQVRTLLQHAYAELTHDLIYKTNKSVNDRAKRLAARSMALVETAGEIFSDVAKEAGKLNELNNELIELGREVLVSWGVNCATLDLNFCRFVLDSMAEMTKTAQISDIRDFLRLEKGKFSESHRKKAERLVLYRQPISVLIYYFVNMNPNQLHSDWPLTMEELRPFYVDSGVKMPD